MVRPVFRRCRSSLPSLPENSPVLCEIEPSFVREHPDLLHTQSAQSVSSWLSEGLKDRVVEECGSGSLTIFFSLEEVLRGALPLENIGMYQLELLKVMTEKMNLDALSLKFEKEIFRMRKIYYGRLVVCQTVSLPEAKSNLCFSYQKPLPR